MPTHDFKNIGEVLNFELLRGTIATIDSATDTCSVSVGGGMLTALLFYHCAPGSLMRANGAIEGAAAGFAVGDVVIVLKRYDNSVIKVIGHVGGPKRCTEPLTGLEYYIAYVDGSVIKIANCKYTDGTFELIKTVTQSDVFMSPFTNPVLFQAKRFTHNVDGVAQDLYFIATSLYINPNPYIGWVNYCYANPTDPLVTQATSTKITATAELFADLNAVNAQVNGAHTYSGDGGGDTWRIMSPGETGDCEDFALTKANALLALGYPASAIHIEGGHWDGLANGHAWLVVQTTAGDYALDTDTNSIILNSSLTRSNGEAYDFRRRQLGARWASISPFAWLANATNAVEQTPSIVSNTWCYYYILDPALNIMYPVPDSTGAISNTTWYHWPFISYEHKQYANTYRYQWSVNFSNDNNSIYISYSYGGLTHVIGYTLSNNTLSLISSSSSPAAGFVGRDGILTPLDTNPGTYDRKTWTDGVINYTKALHSYGVASKPGYYEFEYNYLTKARAADDAQTTECDTIPEASWEGDLNGILNIYDVRYLPVVINRDFISPFYWIGEDVLDASDCYDNVNYPISATTRTLATQKFHDPYGSEVSDNDHAGMSCWPFWWNNTTNPYANEDPYDDRYYAYPWSNIDTDDVLIQSYRVERYVDVGDDVKRIYRDGIEVTAAAAAAAGTTPAQMLGIFYMPYTDRLNSIT